MRTMRIVDQLLTLTSEDSENRSRRSGPLDSLDGVVDRILAETLDRMVLEVGRGRLVLGILEVADALERALALASRTLEEVAESTIVILNKDVGLEEAIQGGAPSEFQFLYGIGGQSLKTGDKLLLTEVLFRVIFGFFKFVV
jgi:hypothetical protein